MSHRTYLTERVAQERNQAGDEEYVGQDDKNELNWPSALSVESYDGSLTMTGGPKNGELHM